MKFFIMGANGFIGRHLVKYLLSKKHKVIALVRRQNKVDLLPIGCKVVVGDPLTKGSWQDEAKNSDVIVNLVGRNIFGRWTNRVKHEIYVSRIESTKQAVNCLNSMEQGVLLNANAVGYYGIEAKGVVKERSPSGRDFLAKLCVDWQNVVLSLADKTKRVVICRIAPVLGRDGGMLPKLLPIFKVGLGGRIGNGKQGFSWIHIYDLVRAFEFSANNKNICGPVNFSSPHLITNLQFTEALSKVLSKPAIFKIPKFFLKIVFKELGEVIAKGPKVLPEVLLKNGFVFEFSEIHKALEDIIWGNIKK